MKLHDSHYVRQDPAIHYGPFSLSYFVTLFRNVITANREVNVMEISRLETITGVINEQKTKFLSDCVLEGFALQQILYRAKSLILVLREEQEHFVERVNMDTSKVF